jgi:hypothetical protein
MQTVYLSCVPGEVLWSIYLLWWLWRRGKYERDAEPPHASFRTVFSLPVTELDVSQVWIEDEGDCASMVSPTPLRRTDNWTQSGFDLRSKADLG